MSERSADPLSDLLAVTGISGSLISRARLCAPFGVASSALGRAVFHTPRSGRCHLSVAAEASVELGPGDVAVLPRGVAHEIRDAPSTPCAPRSSFPLDQGAHHLPTLRNAPDDPTCGGLDLLCGTFAFGEPAGSWLLGPLPDVLVVAGRPEVARFVDATLALVEAELAQSGPGSRLITNRLVEVLVVHVLRAWTATAPGATGGWLAGLADPHLGPVLAAIHGSPARAWELDELSRIAGLSRTRFIQRFRERIGSSPGAFVIAWRIAVARGALRDGAGIAEAADRVGYASEASFSRAFKRVTGVAPGVWRSRRHAQSASPTDFGVSGSAPHSFHEPS